MLYEYSKLQNRLVDIECTRSPDTMRLMHCPFWVVAYFSLIKISESAIKKLGAGRPIRPPHHTGCGHRATPPQLVNITSPIFEVCNLDAPVSIPQPHVETDINCCGINFTISFEDDILMTTPCNKLIKRIWTVIDGCGTSIDETQSIFFRKPRISITAPPNITADCHYANDTDRVGKPVVTSCNPNPTASYTDGTITSEFIYRTWKVTDGCTDVPLFFNQTIKCCLLPTLKITEQTLVFEQCGIPESHPPIVTTDNACCQGYHSLTFNDTVVAAGTCSRKILRMWKVMDGCGKTANASQTIILNEPASNATPPAGITCVDCTHPQSIDPNITGRPVVTGCSTNIKMPYTDATNGSDIARIWSVVDQCASKIVNFTQVISCQQRPLLNSTSAIDHENCSLDYVPVIEPPLVQADQKCCGNNYSLVFADNFEANSNCGREVRRSWRVTDGCGQIANHSQIIHIRKPSPSFSAPPDVTMHCRLAGNTSLSGEPVISGCSSEVSKSYQDDSDGETHINRTWTMVDHCSNKTVSFFQTITCCISPTLKAEPTLEYEQCDLYDTPSSNPVAITDAVCCGGNGSLTSADKEESVTECSRQIRRTWKLIDACGRTAIVNQLLLIEKPLNQYEPPANMSINCESPAAKVPSKSGKPVIQGCDFEVDMSFEDRIEDTCINRTWTVTEKCSSATVVFNQMLTCCRKPTIDIQQPAVSFYQCDYTVKPNVSIPVVTTDDQCCGGESQLDFSDSEMSEGPSGHEFQRTWTVVDACRKTTSVQQRVAIFRPTECDYTTSSSESTTKYETSTRKESSWTDSEPEAIATTEASLTEPTSTFSKPDITVISYITAGTTETTPATEAATTSATHAGTTAPILKSTLAESTTTADNIQTTTAVTTTADSITRVTVTPTAPTETSAIVVPVPSATSLNPDHQQTTTSAMNETGNFTTSLPDASTASSAAPATTFSLAPSPNPVASTTGITTSLATGPPQEVNPHLSAIGTTTHAESTTPRPDELTTTTIHTTVPSATTHNNFSMAVTSALRLVSSTVTAETVSTEASSAASTTSHSIVTTNASVTFRPTTTKPIARPPKVETDKECGMNPCSNCDEDGDETCENSCEDEPRETNLDLGIDVTDQCDDRCDHEEEHPECCSGSNSQENKRLM